MKGERNACNNLVLFFCFDALRPSQQFVQQFVQPCRDDFQTSWFIPVICSG